MYLMHLVEIELVLFASLIFVLFGAKPTKYEPWVPQITWTHKYPLINHNGSVFDFGDHLEFMGVTRGYRKADIHEHDASLFRDYDCYIPESCTVDGFIRKLLAQSPLFSLHPDFLFKPQDIDAINSIEFSTPKYTDSWEWHTFRQKEIESFIPNQHYQDSAVYILENKLRTRNYINVHNKLYPNDEEHIDLMPTRSIINYQDWKDNKQNKEWIDQHLDPIIQIIEDEEPQALRDGLVLKTTWESNTDGFFSLTGQLALFDPLLYLTRTLDKCFADSRFAQKQTSSAGTAAPHENEKSIIIQEKYKDFMEVKLTVIFGQFYSGLIVHQAVWSFTHNKECIAPTKEACERLNDVLPDIIFEEIKYKSELMAKNIGCYCIRFDWFIGGKYGIRLNEIAFPNNYMGAYSTLPRNEIIAKAFTMKGSIYQVRGNREMFVDQNIQTRLQGFDPEHFLQPEKQRTIPFAPQSRRLLIRYP